MVPIADAAADGHVIGVIKECYLIGEEVLRPAMVAVGQAAESSGAAQDDANTQDVSDAASASTPEKQGDTPGADAGQA
jgi:hypothetical protein